ncbi:MAG: hypothetical protein IPN42_00245 [Methylococcaceae bacterium]|nr:hypothetical protein [Methylococcaceae bacterium]
MKAKENYGLIEWKLPVMPVCKKQSLIIVYEQKYKVPTFKKAGELQFRLS